MRSPTPGGLRPWILHSSPRATLRSHRDNYPSFDTVRAALVTLADPWISRPSEPIGPIAPRRTWIHVCQRNGARNTPYPSVASERKRARVTVSITRSSEPLTGGRSISHPVALQAVPAEPAGSVSSTPTTRDQSDPQRDAPARQSRFTQQHSEPQRSSPRLALTRAAAHDPDHLRPLQRSHPVHRAGVPAGLRLE